jgi:predicted dehydrogenase
MTITRRGFLQLGAGASAFNIAPSRMFGYTAPGDRIAMGVIGLGGMGMDDLSAFLGMKDVAVRAVCDVNTCKTQAAKLRVDAHYGNRDCATISDFRELCARSDLDAVVIATPDHSHASIGIEAARNGKAVYGETPFTHTLAEGRAWADAVARHGVVWQSGNWLRSQPAFRQMAAWVRAGGLGPVARVEVGLPGGGRGPAASAVPLVPPTGLDWGAWQGAASACAYRGVCDFHWRWVSAWGGGSLMDGIGLYGDIALWGLGRDATGPVRIEGRGECPSGGFYDTATAFAFRCVFQDGVELAVSDGGRQEKGVGVRWIGRNGDWVWVSRGALETSRPELRQEIFGANNGLLFADAGHYRNFIDCVRTRRTTVAPAEAAHRAASLGHLGQIAMRTGRVIRFDPQTETFLAV